MFAAQIVVLTNLICFLPLFVRLSRRNGELRAKFQSPTPGLGVKKRPAGREIRLPIYPKQRTSSAGQVGPFRAIFSEVGDSTNDFRSFSRTDIDVASLNQLPRGQIA
jgi:hypothetical protein